MIKIKWTSIKWFSLRFWSNIFWISVIKTSLLAAFFRANSSRAAAKLCSSSAKTYANIVIQFLALIFFVLFSLFLQTYFDVLIKCFNGEFWWKYFYNLCRLLFLCWRLHARFLHQASLCNQFVYINFHMEIMMSKDFWLILHWLHKNTWSFIIA